MKKKVKVSKITISIWGQPIFRNKDGEQLAKKCIIKAITKYLPNTSLSVSLKMVGLDEIRQINRDTRNVDKETDVLSFPMLEMNEGLLLDKSQLTDFGGEIMLGDIIMCYDKILSQSCEFGHSKERECAYLSVHSILHLLGFDHVDEGVMKQNMRKAEEEILKEVLI